MIIIYNWIHKIIYLNNYQGITYLDIICDRSVIFLVMSGCKRFIFESDNGGFIGL